MTVLPEDVISTVFSSLEVGFTVTEVRNLPLVGVTVVADVPAVTVFVYV